jgi:hypothetical protein
MERIAESRETESLGIGELYGVSPSEVQNTMCGIVIHVSITIFLRVSDHT